MWGSSTPAPTGKHSPIESGWLHEKQAPVHATLQQTPSVQNPEVHWPPSSQAAPDGRLAPQAFPEQQTPWSQTPLAQSVVHMHTWPGIRLVSSSKTRQRSGSGFEKTVSRAPPSRFLALPTIFEPQPKLRINPAAIKTRATELRWNMARPRPDLRDDSATTADDGSQATVTGQHLSTEMSVFREVGGLGSPSATAAHGRVKAR
jgi:hypothetical protein